MEKCSRVLSVKSDNDDTLLCHLTAGNYEYDMADHNYTGPTYRLTNSMLFTAKQNWEICYAKAEGNTDLAKDYFILLGSTL